MDGGHAKKAKKPVKARTGSKKKREAWKMVTIDLEALRTATAEGFYSLEEVDDCFCSSLACASSDGAPSHALSVWQVDESTLEPSMLSFKVNATPALPSALLHAQPSCHTVA